MPEIIISDFNSTRVPSNFTLGDGSWNGDRDLSGSDMKIGVAGTATTHGGCVASFANLNLSSIMANGSAGTIILYLNLGNLCPKVKLTITDSDGGVVVWTLLPDQGSHIWRNIWGYLCRHTELTGRVGLPDPSVSDPSPGKISGSGGGYLTGTATINWSKINGFKIEGFGGPFAARPFEMGFTNLIAFKA